MQKKFSHIREWDATGCVAANGTLSHLCAPVHISNSEMNRHNDSTYYLYDIGYSPDRLTLGTLVFGNYARPDHRYITFPRLR